MEIRTSLVCDVPAKDTCVVSAGAPGTLHLLPSTVRPVCIQVQATKSPIDERCMGIGIK